MIRYVYSRICCFFCIQKAIRKKKTKIEQEEINAQEMIHEDSKSNNGLNNELKIDDFSNISLKKYDAIKDTNCDYEDMVKVNVPLSISLIFILAYILSGALIFKSLENWSFISSSYFVAATLTTIGKFKINKFG